MEQKEHKTLNCLMAKQLCDEDSNCSAILKVIPTLCGPELVACSTVTVSRCQAALRTLVIHSWFQPTCLCKEPRIDPQCNAFRDLLFDHPCVFVNRKEVDMHPLEYIPTCERAADICSDNPWCKQRLDMFVSTCKFRDGQCRNPDREDCLKAWLQLRETPLLGCICPDGQDRNCSRLYSLVNENPCVGDTYIGRLEAMTAVAKAVETPLAKQVSVPPGAASLLVISSSHKDPVFPIATNVHIQNNKPSSKYDHSLSLEKLKHVAGTCQSALEDCVSDSPCRSHLEMISGHCDSTNCHKHACKSAIQDLYKHLLETNHKLALKIGLCVCRDTGERGQEECRRAQRRLHPECAEMTDSLSVSQCHNLGRDCRSDRICRYRLEHYELSCAADTMTGRCAGQHQECTKAMLGLLGTDLHTNCVCKGNSFHDMNHCLAWKRLLWGNPCVVESQVTYHLSQLGIKSDAMAPSLDDSGVERGIHDQGDNASPLYTSGRNNDQYDSAYDPSNDPDVELLELGEGGTRLQARKVGSTPQSDHTVPHYAGAPPMLPTSLSSTTLPTTTTLPERYCEVKRDTKSHIIEEGSSMRLYKEGDNDCSELCFCERNEQTKCKVLDCVENRPCETGFAVYNHNAPAYQAFRGECICYSGDFICMRPKMGEYNLTTGLFLLMGFSKTEEALLKNVTGGSAVDALLPLQKIVRTISADMGDECRLELSQHTTDNLVLQVRHFQVSPGIRNNTYTLYMLQEERNKCIGAVQKVAAMINRRDPKIHHDVRLSVFVLAEVVDNVPNPQRISGARPSPRVAGVEAWWWACATAMVLAAFGREHTSRGGKLCHL
ncbi:uncharacterized protein LOC119587789 isoform X1 [Penaeus monodon]|uniref:uncharacterized protein LOC119587789 isoform X1 n=1 Tax=Penaeus monodon TaxID=6687 RepID=UPI0018A7D91A|nr:uncharacterized protein LOC119587789 isoform X1 [Penaeus monodon]